MGVFPEDYEISVSRLIKLWVAEGFLKPNSLKRLEEVAEEYLKDLIDRSLIMVHKRNFLGETKTCIIHDLLRELCIKKARDENFLMVLNRDLRVVPVIGDNERRVSIHSKTCPTGTHESRIRSFLYFSKYSADNLSLSFLRFRHAKVMHLGVTFYKFFPVEIVQLVNLRYLALTCVSMYEFPESIVKLQNLQTLIIRQDVIDSDHVPIFDLPFEIWEMPQLRHLLFEKNFLPRLSVKRINPCILEHLLTLSNVGNLVCRKEVLESMPNLKKLGIFYRLDNDDKPSSFELNNLICLTKLETLKLSFNAYSFVRGLPGNFAFPCTLKKLTLSGCEMSWNNMTIIGSLPNLEVLKLKHDAFVGRAWEPNEGEFLRLKVLVLHWMFSLKKWEANEMNFPNLEHLAISHCLKLEEIPIAIGDIPTLKIIEVKECSTKVVESAKLIQEEQKSLGNDTLQIRVETNSPL